MNKLLLLSLLVFYSFLAQSQVFEGEVQYSFEVKGEQAEMMKAFLPSSMKVKIKGASSLTLTEGGMASAEILTINGQSYMLDRAAKTAQKMPKQDEATSKDLNTKSTVKKTNEKQTIAGYVTEKYIVTSEMEGKKVQVLLWISDKFDLPNEVRNTMFKDLKGMLGTKGFPLKIEMEQPISETESMSMIMTVTSIKKMAIEAKDVELPKDFKVTKFEANSMMNGLGR